MQRLLTARTVLCGPAAHRIEHGAVLIEDDVILAVGSAPDVEGRAAASAQRQDFPTGTILPGLIDAHVHLAFDATPDIAEHLAQTSDPELLENMAERASHISATGITTVRDLGDRNGLALHLRDAIARGDRPGPRILSAGTPLTIPSGHGWFLGGAVTSRTEIRDHIRHQAERGVDVIKVMASGGHITSDSPAPWDAQFDADELRTIVDHATEAGLPVAAHAHGTPTIAAAVDTGVTTIEHCTWMRSDDHDIEPVIERMAALDVPTCLAWPSDWPALLDSLGDLAPRTLHKLARTASRVPLLFGTDTGVIRSPAGAEPADALKLYTTHLEYTAEQALDLATTRTAALLGIAHRTGTLSPGLAADLLIAEGDPTHNLDALRHRHLVLAAGRPQAAPPAGHSTEPLPT